MILIYSGFNANKYTWDVIECMVIRERLERNSKIESAANDESPAQNSKIECAVIKESPRRNSEIESVVNRECPVRNSKRAKLMLLFYY